MSAKKENGEAIRLIDSYLGPAYNPDVLSCLANLSNDEVFTPPEVVNDMLDMLPPELFEDPDVTFLDPVCKSGVFLREIAKRLVKGLEKKIPNLHERIENIYMRQLFGIAITELTSLISRRSLYCSKYADGKFSIVPFESSEGNIRFKNLGHTWINGKCKFCGVSETEYGVEARGQLKESHAYEFIHTNKPKELWNMNFDVIIGNPPYQMADAGAATSASPIYHKFIEVAKSLNPNYITMIIPARWYSGSKGLDKFRNDMINDTQIINLVDYFDSTECFPGVDISGGVCYFVWQNQYKGMCNVVSHFNGTQSALKRYLKEKDCDVFIRFNEAIPILHKIQSFKEPSFKKYVSSLRPFGLRTYIKGSDKRTPSSVLLYSNKNTSSHIGYVERDEIKQNVHWIDSYKVYISRAYGERGSFPYLVLGKPFLGKPNSCCTETYLHIGPFRDKKTTENVIQYINTKFFRFLALLMKNTQDAPARVYSLIPVQDFEQCWTDDKLYKKYSLSSKEIAFIESMIRPMK